MRAGFSAEGQFTKLSTRQLWLVVFFASEKSAGEVKQRECSSCLPGRFDDVSVPPNASASTPSRTPADFSADMALGGSGHADTINPYPTRATRFADLRDHAVRLMKWRDWQGLYRCRESQGKGKSDQPDHWFSFLIGDVSWLSAATFDNGFGQAPLPIMESKVALASTIVAYLPSCLYLPGET